MSNQFQIPAIGPFLDMPIVGEDGKLTPAWRIYFQQLIDILQNVISPEGIRLPPQTASNIAILNSSDAIGSILFNTNTSKGMLNETGIFKTITTS